MQKKRLVARCSLGLSCVWMLIVFFHHMNSKIAGGFAGDDAQTTFERFLFCVLAGVYFHSISLSA